MQFQRVEVRHAHQQAEHKIFQKLQAMVPNLLDRVFKSEVAFMVIVESV